ncbi:MAG TPA: DMT family transporter, partial [Candidatus Acidoferrales bacterium]|nr:DMT family transporter [Candidatus Acidoferrales bacterium]
MRRSESLTKVLLAAGAISGGGAFVVGHLAVAGTPPATLGALRYILATGLFGLLLGFSRGAKRIPRGADALRILGMGLAVVAGYNLLFLEGLRLAPAADGGLIVPGSAPTFSILLGWALLRERPRNRALIGSALAGAGILAIFAAAGGLGDALPGRRLGDLLYLAGGSMWGIFNVLARGFQGRVHPLPANAYAAGVGLAVLLPLALLTEGPAGFSSLTPATLLEAAYLAVFATVLLLWANVRGVERLGVARAAPFAYLAPLAAVAGGVLVLGERISGLELLGG